ncbi:MAG TPA: type 2 isopentenyl-diphosphate Delta-isomerase [Pseudomonadota bacterium]|nr:type 2 isopentenyl-diphosphate Delta-isomerase [Pseudomonadota bacterium]
MASTERELELSQQQLISRRKSEHLELCASGKADFKRKTALWNEVELVHQSLPEMHLGEVDMSTSMFGKVLRAPLFISAMTGGTDEALKINRELAQLADELGIGFGLGSQRAMVVRPETKWTFQVRKWAPNTLILGNVGLVQAGKMHMHEILGLCQAVGADALCVHLSPAMEMVQPGGDRDFRMGKEKLAWLAQGFPLPLIVKETGCGLSRQVGLTLRDLGVKNVDVSGAGGTSWVGVETNRAAGAKALVGQALWDWGIPTAASVGLLSDLGFDIIATGGLQTGLDVAAALSLGAKAGGIAGPVLKAWKNGGQDRARLLLEGVIETLRTVLLLTGCRTPGELRSVPKLLGPRLSAWLQGAR